MSAARGLARAAALVSAAAVLFAAGGCSLLGRSGAAPTADPAPAGEGVDVAASEGSGAAAVADSTAAPAAPAPVVPAPAASAAADSAAARAPAPAEANDQVRFELSDRERDELLAQATRTITEIRRRLDKLDRSKLDAGRQEKLRTIESLVHNAEDAMGDDVRASATLSRKARLLLDDLTAP